MKTDDEIIDEVTMWERKDIKRRERRWQSFVRVVEFIFGCIVIAIALATTSLWLKQCSEAYHERVQERERQEFVKQQAIKRLHEQYERAWESCISELDLEVCDLIEARLAERCLATQSTSDDVQNVVVCLKHEKSQVD